MNVVSQFCGSGQRAARFPKEISNAGPGGHFPVGFCEEIRALQYRDAIIMERGRLFVEKLRTL